MSDDLSDDPEPPEEVLGDPSAAPAAGPLAVDPRAVTIGGPVLWLQVEPDGAESVRSGAVWAVAPPVGGQRSWWVLPDAQIDAGRPLAVLRASRRARVGRVETRDGMRAWRPHAGRYVDVGTLYAESHPRSATGAAAARVAAQYGADVRAAMTFRVLTSVEFAMLSGDYLRGAPLGLDKG